MANRSRPGVSNVAHSNSSRRDLRSPPTGTGDSGGNVTAPGRDSNARRLAYAKSSPHLRSGRPVRRDPDSDEESSSSLDGSHSDDDTAKEVPATSRPLRKSSAGDEGSTSTVENPSRLPRTSAPTVHSVQDARLLQKPHVSQGYFAAHLPHRSLHDAVLRRDLASLQAILHRDNTQIDARDYSCRTALHHAAGAGQIEFVKALLEARPDIDLGDLSGTTALMLAAKNGHAAVVRLLIKHGADQQMVGVPGVTALDMAARYGHLDALDALLVQEVAFRKTAPMDPVNPFVKAMCLAARHGHEAIVRALLAAGAPAAVCNRNGKSAIMHALEAGHLKVVASMLPHISASSWITDGASIVNLAVKSAVPEHLELLLKHDGTVSRGIFKGTARDAPASRTYRALSTDIGNGRGVAAPQISLASTALLSAAAQGKPALAEVALRWGGSLTAVDFNRNTALMAALQVAGSTVAMTPTIDLLIESANPTRRKRDPAVYNSETLIERLVSRLSQQHLVIQPRFWLGMTNWLCTERRLRYSVVAPLVSALKQMFEAWPGLSGGRREDDLPLPISPAQKKALCGHTLATLQGLHTLQNDLGALQIFTGSPPVAPCYILGISTAKPLLEEAKAHAQGLIDLGAKSFGKADLAGIAGELSGLAQPSRRDIVMALCANTALHQVLAEAVADAWLDVGPARQTAVAHFRKALWEQIDKPVFWTKCEEQNDLLRGLLLEQLTDLLEYPRT
jgi:ankyrin repeat protein